MPQSVTQNVTITHLKPKVPDSTHGTQQDQLKDAPPKSTLRKLTEPTSGVAWSQALLGQGGEGVVCFCRFGVQHMKGCTIDDWECGGAAGRDFACLMVLVGYFYSETGLTYAQVWRTSKGLGGGVLRWNQRTQISNLVAIGCQPSGTEQ